MEKTINIQDKANIAAEGKLNSRHCKPIICLETGEVFTSVTDAAESIGCSANNLSTHLTGKRRHIKGKHFCYLSRATESLDVIVSRLRETSSMEEDARKWRAYQAEQEAIRKAEEDRIEAERKAKEKYEADVAKARNKVARRQTICERLKAQLAEAEKRLVDAKIELEALEDNEKEAEVA
jgi:chromosome segregation ATPase